MQYAAIRAFEFKFQVFKSGYATHTYGMSPAPRWAVGTPIGTPETHQGMGLGMDLHIGII